MPTISYRFRAYGAADVVKDYDGITAAAGRAKKASGEYGRAARPKANAAANAEAAAAAQSAKAQMRTAEQLERYKARVRDASLRQEQRMRERDERAAIAGEKRKSRALEQEEQRRLSRLRGQHAREARARETRRQRAMGGIAGVAGGGLGIVGGAAVGVAAPLIAASAWERDRNLRQAQALSTAGRGAGQVAADPKELLRDATGVAKSVRGSKTADVLAGMQKFVSATGDLEGARVNAKTFSVVARATGASESDIASTAATMRDKFGITDPDELRQALARMTMQGKSGAFEMGDASRYFTELGASGQRFGLDKGAAGAATLGGLAQVARMSTGSGAEASTATQAMLRQLIAKSSDIRKTTGARVFTDSTNTKTRNVQDVLAEVIGGAGGDLTKLQKIFGDEGIAGVSALISTFNEASNAMGKGASEAERRAAGEAAVRKMLDQTINAGGEWSDVLQDASANTNNASDKLTTAWETASEAAADGFNAPIDAFAANAEVFGAALGALGEVAGEAIDGLAAMVKFLQSKGLIDKPTENKPSLAPGDDLVANLAEQAELAASKQRNGGLSADKAKRLRELKANELTLREQIDADPAHGGIGSAAAVAGSVFGFGALGAGVQGGAASKLDRYNMSDVERVKFEAGSGLGPAFAPTMESNPLTDLRPDWLPDMPDFLKRYKTMGNDHLNPDGLSPARSALASAATSAAAGTMAPSTVEVQGGDDFVTAANRFAAAVASFERKAAAPPGSPVVLK